VPTRTRLLLLVAAAVPLALASGCPQLASDDFTKADEFDSDGSGGSGSDDDGANSTSIDLSNGTQTASDGYDSTASTSQGGTDAGNSEVDSVTSSTDTSGGTAGTAGSGGTGGTGGSGGTTSSGGSTSSDTSSSGGGSSDGGTGGVSTDGESTSSGCVVEVEICDGLDNDCDGEPDNDSACDTSYGCQGFAFDDHGYMYCPRPASHEEAAAQCDGQGMTLVQIDSEPENDELVAQATAGWSGGNDGTGGSGSGSTWGGWTSGGEQQQEAFWTGGSDESAEGDWIWSGSGTPFWEGDADGSAVDGAYTNWGEDRPNAANDEGENCMAVYVADGSDGDMGTWNDLLCADSYPFICETPASD